MDILAWQVQGYGRTAIYEGKPDWAYEDENYKVTELGDIALVQQALQEHFPDEFQTFRQTANELFDLQGQQIELLKTQLKEFAEATIAIYEATSVVSHSAIENRAKLILVNETCKGLLKSRLEDNPAEI